MLTVTNRKIYRNLPFEDYLKLTGVSHSDIRNKGQKITPTTKMHLGTLVHTYLLTPWLYTGESSALVIPIAKALKAEIQPLLAFLEPELSVTADFIADGWKMPYRGRADLGIVDRFGIDIKVSEMPLKKAVEYFGYVDQQNGYALGFGFKAVTIVSISPVTLAVTMFNVPMFPDFWAAQVPSYGKPVKESVRL